MLILIEYKINSYKTYVWSYVMHIYKILCTSFNRLVYNVPSELVTCLLQSPLADYSTLYCCFYIIIIKLLLKIILLSVYLCYSFFVAKTILLLIHVSCPQFWYWQISRNLAQVFKIEWHVFHVQLISYSLVYHIAFMR